MIQTSYSIRPWALVRSLKQHKDLLVVLIKHDIMTRYKGSILGLLWSIVLPLIMLAVYTFVFSIAFKARWGADTSESKENFALVLFAGLIVYNFFSECINRAPVIILQNVNYVKKVVFPLETLPLLILGTAFFNTSISLGIWILGHAVLIGLPPNTCLLVPFILLPLGIFSLGMAYFFAALGVYIRDIGHVIGILTTLLMFLSPIFYPITAIPEEYRFLLNFNPLTPILEWIRGALYWGTLPHFGEYSLVLFGALLCLCLGFAWFQKTRKGFADVL